MDAELENLLKAELGAAMSRGGGRRKRMRGGMQVIAAVKALKAALCSTGRMTLSDAVNSPVGLMTPITDYLNKVQEDSDEGKAAKAAFYSKIKTLLKASVGGIAFKDLASPNSKIVRVAVVILNALNEALPNPIEMGIQKLPDLGANLALMATSAGPVINTAIVTAACFWALRAVGRRAIQLVDGMTEVFKKIPEDLSDEKTDKAIDAVLERVPQLAEMALSAGRAAVRGAGSVWAGRLRSASRNNSTNPERAVVAAAAIGAGAGQGAAAAALADEGRPVVTEDEADAGDIADAAAAPADGEAADAAAPAPAAAAETVAGRRRTRKLRKMRRLRKMLTVRRKRTLRRKH